MKYGFGVDLGGTTVKIAYFDQEGNLLTKWEIPTRSENGGSQILPDIAASVNGFIQEQKIPREELMGIGIGVPGPVDDRGVVSGCVNIGWGVTDVAGILSGLTGLPVKAGNDATVAALGESWKGSGGENMIFATLGTGVGGGIILDGKPVHGRHGAGGEIGHITINPAETESCNCGRRGCVEQYCSATGVVRLAKRYLTAHDTPSVLRNTENFACKDVFDAAKEGDEAAVAILEQVYDYMGLFFANLCCTVDPDVVVLGGGVSKAGTPLLEGVERAFRKHAFHGGFDITFKLASLSNDAGAYGACKLILDI